MIFPRIDPKEVGREVAHSYFSRDSGLNGRTWEYDWTAARARMKVCVYEKYGLPTKDCIVCRCESAAPDDRQIVLAIVEF